MKRCINCRTLFPVNTTTAHCPYCGGQIMPIENELKLVRPKKKDTPIEPKKKKILVVDDVGFITEGIKFILENEGYNVKTANSADEAIKEVRRSHYDLLILDIMMPGMPVSMLIESIRDSDTKIIYCSAVPEKEAETKTILSQENIIGYIRKPFDINLLLEAVESAV